MSCTLSIIQEHTDNLNLTATNKQSDFITTLQPGFTLVAIGQTQGLDLSYDPSQSWYTEHAENNTLRHNARLNAWSQLSRTARLDFNNTFIYTEEPLTIPESDTGMVTDTEIDTDSEERVGREPYYRNMAAIGFSNRFGPTEAITLSYRNSMLENEDDDLEDSQENTPSLSWEYGLSRELTSQGTASFTRGEFDESDDFERYFGSVQLAYQINRRLDIFALYEHTVLFFSQDEDNNYHLKYPSTGLNYQVGETTRLSLGVGYLWVAREVEGDEEGLLFNSDITQTCRLRRGSLALNATSGYDQSYFDERNLGLRIYYQGRGTVNFELLKDISASLSGSYRNDTYLDTEDGQEDYTTTGRVGLTYNRLRHVSATLSYDYRLRDSSADDEDYQENRISLNITFRPDQPMVIIK